MIRTKGQNMLRCSGQNANHRKKSGWHLVWLAFCPVGILSYHPIQPHELVTHSKEKPFKCDHCNFSSTQVFNLKRHKHNATLLLLNLVKLVNTSASIVEKSHVFNAYLIFVNFGTPPDYLALKKYTKKCVISQQNSQTSPK